MATKQFGLPQGTPLFSWGLSTVEPHKIGLPRGFESALVAFSGRRLLDGASV